MELEKIADWIMTHSGLLEGNDIIAEASPFHHYSDQLHHDYQGNRRLGFIYQYVCSELFHSSSDYELLAEEIQLIENKKTLGAIDFITRHHQSQKIEHWEVAIKFYLLYDGLWYGPNSQDRLDKKLARMLNHQLSMSDTPLFKQSYPQWQPIVPKLLMQGRLYINPFRSEKTPTHCLHIPINKDRVNGYWCFQSEAENIPEPLYSLEKWQWITGYEGSEGGKGNADGKGKLDDFSPFEKNFVHAQTKDGTFWFIVPNNWPEQ